MRRKRLPLISHMSRSSQPDEPLKTITESQMRREPPAGIAMSSKYWSP